MADRGYTPDEQDLARRVLGIPDPGLNAPDLDAPIYEAGPPEIDPRLGAFDWDPIRTNPFEELPPPTPEALERAKALGTMPAPVFPDAPPEGTQEKARWDEDRQAFEEEEIRRREAELGGFRIPHTGSASGSVSAKSSAWPKLQRVGMPSTEGIREHGERAVALGEERQSALGEIQGQHGEAFGRYRDAAQQGAEAGIEKAAELANFREQADNDLDAYDRTQADKEAKRQEIMKEKLAEIEGVNEKLANAKIDPDRFYKHEDGSTNYGKRILMGLAMGLGAFGTALAGGQNDAMTIIENAINRDVDAQKSTLANKRSAAAAKNSELGILRGILGDERLAENSLRRRKIERVRSQLDTISAKFGGREAQARAKELDAKLETQLFELKKNDMSISFDFASKMMAEEGAAERAAFSGGMQKAQIRAGENAKAHHQKLQELAARTKVAGGKPLPAGALDKLSGYQGAMKILDDLEGKWNEKLKGYAGASIAQYMPWTTEPEIWEHGRQASAQILGKKLEGRMTDEDFKRFAAMIPHAGQYTSLAKEKFEQMRSVLRHQIQAVAETYAVGGHDVTGLVQMANPGGEFKARMGQPAQRK